MLRVILSAPLTFLALEDERGVKLAYHNIISTILLALALSAPFLIADSSNFFHKDGFLDKVSSFSSVLTGFYVAGLVAVAAFSPALGDVDATIEEGKVTLKAKSPEELDHDLSRREYVSYLFGYLSSLSLIVTLFGITVVIVSTNIFIEDISFEMFSYVISISGAYIRGIGIFFVCLLLAHMFIVTIQGIYYLTERLYTRKPETLPLIDGHDDTGD